MKQWLNKLKEKINREEIYVAKKRNYPNRIKLGVILAFSGLLSAVGLYIITDNIWLPVVGVVVIVIGVILVAFSDNYICWADVITKDGTVFYKVKDLDEDYETIEDAFLCAEGGPNFDPDEDEP